MPLASIKDKIDDFSKVATEVGDEVACVVNEESIYARMSPSGGPPSFVDLQRIMRPKGAPAIGGRVERVLRFTEELLSLNDSEIDTERAEFMDLLAGVHLALYFSGFPIGHAWARVRRLAQIPNGYRKGVCVYKANGDVYRRARQMHRREFAGVRPQDLPASAVVLVHTREPVFLTSYAEVVRASHTSALAGAIHGLGYLYNLLQAVLYVGERLPLRYVLRRAALTHGNSDAAFQSNAIKRIVTICSWAGRGQEMILVDDALSPELPGCVLGYKAGFYTPADTLANHSKEDHHDHYRAAVTNLAGTSLKGSDAAHIRQLLERPPTLALA